MRQLLVTYHDPAIGAARAYAFGPGDRKADVRKLARQQLSAYCTTQRAVDEGWEADDFEERLQYREGDLGHGFLPAEGKP